MNQDRQQVLLQLAATSSCVIHCSCCLRRTLQNRRNKEDLISVAKKAHCLMLLQSAEESNCRHKNKSIETRECPFVVCGIKDASFVSTQWPILSPQENSLERTSNSLLNRHRLQVVGSQAVDLPLGNTFEQTRETWIAPSKRRTKLMKNCQSGYVR